MYKERIKKVLNEAIKKAGYKKPAGLALETPKYEKWGDYAVNILLISKERKENPKKIAQKIIQKIKTDWLQIDYSDPGYINLTIKNKMLIDNLENISAKSDKYGSDNIGKGKTVVIDYSAPNIAKPFSVGHFRATIIGQVIYNVYKFLGYKVIGDNHIGDWGTQFGKLIVAYKKWGDRSKIKKNPINELLKLYIRFHKEAEKKPILNKEAKEWFRKLEKGDNEAREIWQWVKEESLKEFQFIYDLLNIKFDETLGESFYQDKLEDITHECEKKKLAKWKTAFDEKGKPVTNNEKVLLIDLKKYGINTPLLIKKSDGTSLYATRDLATAKYRVNKWKPSKIIYAVGADQNLYFKQWFKVFELLGYKTSLEHINFGMIRMKEGKMSTRRGRIVLMGDILDEVILRAGRIIQSEDISKYDKEKIARVVGVGAVIYADLSQNRTQDVVFDYDKMLALKGNSGPYLQYTYARAKSILRRAQTDADLKYGPTRIKISLSAKVSLNASERNLLRKIIKFDEVVKKSAKSYMPNYIANYLFELAEEFNSFYQLLPVLKAEKNKKQLRLAIVSGVAQVLKNGLKLLGIETLEKM